MRKIIGSVPMPATPIWKAIAASTIEMTSHTMPRTGCFMIAGWVVNGHRSKWMTTNMPASTVT